MALSLHQPYKNVLNDIGSLPLLFNLGQDRGATASNANKTLLDFLYTLFLLISWLLLDGRLLSQLPAHLSPVINLGAKLSNNSFLARLGFESFLRIAVVIDLRHFSGSATHVTPVVL